MPATAKNKDARDFMKNDLLLHKARLKLISSPKLSKLIAPISGGALASQMRLPYSALSAVR